MAHPPPIRPNIKYLGLLNFNTKIPKIQTVSKGINENVAWNFIEFSEELIKWLGH
jgi:hypothetical protein